MRSRARRAAVPVRRWLAGDRLGRDAPDRLVHGYRLALAEKGGPQWAWDRALSALTEARAAGVPRGDGGSGMKYRLPDAPAMLRAIADELERWLSEQGRTGPGL